MTEEKASRTVLVVTLASAAGLACLACLVLGHWLGRRQAAAKIDERIREIGQTERLGWIAGERRAGMALCYDDPARAAAEMDDYAWAVPNVPTPFVGIAPEPGRHGNATISEDQFRHPRPVVMPKPAGVYRIFFTGGSTAFGTGAPSDDTTISAYLQGLFDRELAPRTGLVYEVINAANGAWASTHERVQIENRLSELEPDLVISFSGNNDAHWGFIGMHSLWFRNYAETHFARVVQLAYQLTGRDFQQPKSLALAGHVPPADVAARLVKNLRLATAALAPTGAPFVFVLQPTLADTKKPLTERERKQRDVQNDPAHGLGPGCTAYFAEVYELYRAQLPALGLPGLRFVDLSGVFDQVAPGTELFLDSYHFGDKGNRLIAERLFAELGPILAQDR